MTLGATMTELTGERRPTADMRNGELGHAGYNVLHLYVEVAWAGVSRIYFILS